MNSKTVQQIWKERKWPIRDGIYFADENVALMDLPSTNIVSHVKLSALKEFHEDYTTCLIETFKQEYLEGDVVFLCGEGSYGSEGFVAACQLRTKDLIWLAYFSESNPFEKVSLLNGIVTAVSNLGHKWQFPMEKPETLKVDF